MSKTYIVEKTVVRELPEMERPSVRFLEDNPLFNLHVRKILAAYNKILSRQPTITRGDNGFWKEGQIVPASEIDFKIKSVGDRYDTTEFLVAIPKQSTQQPTPSNESVEQMAERILGKYEPNEEYQSYYHEQDVIAALVEMYQQAQGKEWVKASERLPEIDYTDAWNAKAEQSADVWTFSEFGLKRGRYFHSAGFWTIDSAASSNGIGVTHWMPLTAPPEK